MLNEWFKRSQSYANLKWTKDWYLLEAIKKECKLSITDTVCDIGTGTGLIAKHLQPWCTFMEAIDTSRDMLARASYMRPENIHYHLMDAEKMDFKSHKFDCVVSRMAFHHIGNLHKAFTECHRILKKDGRLVICEAIPPIACYNFYKEVFNLKEARHVFRAQDIINLFEFYSFKNVTYQLYTMKGVSISNWLSNSNLPLEIGNRIFDMWKNAPAYVNKAHNLAHYNGDVLVDWLFIIVSGEK